MAKVCIFLAEGFEEIEALTVVDVLRRANIEITMVSVTGTELVAGSHGIAVKADRLFDDMDFGDTDMLVLPGGMPGTRNLNNHEGLSRLLKTFYEKGKDLAAICAAPMVLGTKGFLNGKNATCFPGFEEYLAGARCQAADVVTDGNIVTSRGMGTALDFALSLVTKLKSREEAVKLSQAIQYRHFQP
jgi:4-methyl-5(b-hydroxyethyl)-thiazole monophosphate biosynthesis